MNVIAAERLCSVLTPRWAAQGWGRVINISLIYGAIGQNRDNTGKAAVDGGWSVRSPTLRARPAHGDSTAASR